MLIEQRVVRVFSRESSCAACADVGVLQRPGRFVNPPIALAPVTRPPGGGGPERKTDDRPNRGREPFRFPRQPQPGPPTRN